MIPFRTPRRPRSLRPSVWPVSLALFWAATLTLGAASVSLPKPAADALRASFPEARITGVRRERERGAWYYEVGLKEGTRRIEVEVSDEGVIGEIEAAVRLNEMPETLVRTIRQRVGNGRLGTIEKHERRGIVRSGTWVPLKTPRTLYEVRYATAAGDRREFQLSSSEVLELPEAVQRNLRATYGHAPITEVEAEADEGVTVFRVALRTSRGPVWVVVSRDGRVLEKETPHRWEDAPRAVSRTVSADRRQDDRVVLLKRETDAVVDDGEIVGRHDVTYLARLTRGDRQREYRFDAEGRLTRTSEWEPLEDDDEEDDDEDDD